MTTAQRPEHAPSTEPVHHASPELPAIRKGQVWLFQGQDWRVHELLTEGVVVLMGPYRARDLNGVTAEELYAAGELRAETSPARSKKAQRMVDAMERARLRGPGRAKIGRPKKPKPPSAYQPWRCCVLAVDTASNSGWSLWVDGVLIDSGEVKKDSREKMIALCERAHTTSDPRYDAAATQHRLLGMPDRPAVLVLEAASGFVLPGRGASTLIGLGAARQAWQEAWTAAGGLKSRRVSVVPTRWRGALFGSGAKGLLGQRRKAADMEADWAAMHLGRMGRGERVAGADEATAICIGCWAARAGEVGEALPFKLRVHAR